MQVVIKTITVIWLCYFYFTNDSLYEKERVWIPVTWVDDLEGDFSFKNQWNYPENVYKNSFSQLSCDGDCPPEISFMKDDEGRIYTDSLVSFYQLVDTTHLPYSMKSETNVYEWAGANYMSFSRQIDSNSIIGQSVLNISTHSNLHVKINGDTVTAWVEYSSIKNIPKHIFFLRQGQMMLDRKYFDKGFIKAKFYLNFENDLEPSRDIFWKGLIYSSIEKE